MGWASGSGLMDQVIRVVKKSVPDDKARHAIYLGVIKAFEDEDCDTLGECLDRDEQFDAALKKLNPGIYDEEE